MTSTNPLDRIGKHARGAAQILAQATTGQKNMALQTIRHALQARTTAILVANEKDVSVAKSKGMAEAQLDRLRLTEAKFKAMLEAIDTIHDLPDPIDRLLDNVTRPNGMRIEKRSVPIGVIGIIFESRPNVAIDAATLCLKSGNACILRGGSESWLTVQALVEAMQAGLKEAELPPDVAQILPATDREYVGHLLTLDAYVDLIIPRGGKSLIARVQNESRIPVLSHLDGICHTYIDTAADPAKAVAIAVNAKMRRTSICGATECLVLHKKIATTLGKDIIAAMLNENCEVRVPEQLIHLDGCLKLATAADYGVEFLAPILAVAIVNDVESAVAFINKHNSQHTDAIVTEDDNAANYFLRHVSSAIALHNASTQFADGGEFGKGAEVGIATGKLHARGPVGLEELTTYQYRVHGTGQIRPL